MLRAGAANGHARAVVEYNVKRFNVVCHFAAEQAVDAATVVADHAAQGAAAVRGGVGGIGQVVQFGGLAKAVENDARLHSSQLGGGVDRVETVHIPGVIKDHGHIGALAGQAGARAARQHGCSGGPAGGKRGFNIGGVPGQNHADRELAVVRGVGCVESAGTKVEADVATKRSLE